MYFTVIYNFVSHPTTQTINQFISSVLTECVHLGYTVNTIDLRYTTATPSNISIKYTLPGPIQVIHSIPYSTNNDNVSARVFEYSV